MVETMLLSTELEISWYYRTKQHYIDKAYKFSKFGDKFIVKIEDMQDMASVEIEIKCDYCEEVFKRRYCDHVKIKNKELEIEKDSCIGCKDLKKRELLEIRQNNGLISKDDHGYWTLKENRLNELKKYIDDHGHANVMRDDKAKSLRLSIERYDKNIMYLLYDLGYENPKELINHKLPNYYDNFNNLRKEIQLFIDKEGHFPNQQELTYDLKISSRYTGKHGGIYEIRRKMGYNDENSYMDDKGFFNKSYYEFVTAQYLINNTDIDYKREQHPFPKNEGQFRSDFTFFIDNVPYHIEVWGYPDTDERFRNIYNDRKERKIKLYKKYNINMIGIQAQTFLNKTIDNIQESLYNIFEPYMQLKTRKLNNDIFFNPKMTDEEIFNCLMTYSTDGETLPKVPDLKGTEIYKFYSEAVKRYGSYQIFAEKFGSHVHHRRNYWTLEIIHEKIFNLISNGEYVIRPRLRELNMHSLESAIQNIGSIIEIKLDVYFDNINNLNFLMNIHSKELKFLENVMNNRGANIMNKVTPDQQEQAKQILDKYYSNQLSNTP